MMQFRIADTFTVSLARLPNDSQKPVKTTVFDLQMNSANLGISFHNLDGGKDQDFWYVRVSRNIRWIVHKTSSNLLLCYVDHHDKAYKWAEVHPKTGVAQLVQVFVERDYSGPDRVSGSVGTGKTIVVMHLAKGLEFQAVVVMACDDEVISSQERIENIADHADLKDVYNTERHVFYVACTCTRYYLLVTNVNSSSEFLDGLEVGGK